MIHLPVVVFEMTCRNKTTEPRWSGSVALNLGVDRLVTITQSSAPFEECDPNLKRLEPPP